MNEKRKAIIAEAMLLFATKGYHSTSMQEIAEKVGISKGGIYLYFSSKNELLLEIYRYYYENLKKKMDDSVRNQKLQPKEKLQVQIAIYLEELLYQKEFILMHLNDHVGFSTEVKEFLQTVKGDLVRWFQEHFIKIYGEKIKPHTFDLTIMLKGMIESYLITLLRTNILLPVNELAAYLISCTDDLAEGILKKKEGPQLELSLNLANGQITVGERLWRKQLYSCISQIENQLHLSEMDDEERKDCIDSIELLKEEIEREKPRKMIFRGLLNNLAIIPETDHIAENMFMILNDGNIGERNRHQEEVNS